MSVSGDNSTKQLAFSPGDMLGHLYRVVRDVGRGAQGHVYEVEHVRLKTRFAAKVLHPHLAKDPHSIKRFEREASMASQLAHPSIARVVNFDQTEDGQHFAILELLEGEDLRERLTRGALTVGDACTLTEQIASALEVAHDAGVVHRDLKPSNLFLTRDDATTRVKLTDFGISKVLLPTQEETQLTQTGAVVGTPLYMAPEQAAGEAIDHRVDVYALGVVLFEMLAARPPFRSKRAHELLVEKTFMDSPKPGELLPNLPPRLAEVLEKAIAKRPADRYQTMGELVVALQAALQDKRVDREMLVTVVDLPPLEEADYAAATTPPPPPPRRSQAPIFAGAGALAGLLIAFAGYLALGPNPADEPAPLAAPPPPAESATATAATARIARVTVTSEPPGAQVTDPAGARRGTTPLTVDLESAGTWTLARAGRTTTVELDPALHADQTVRVVLPAAPAPSKTRRRRGRGRKAPDPSELMDVEIQ